MTNLINLDGTPPTCITDDQFITALKHIGDDVESFAELLAMKNRWELYYLLKSEEGKNQKPDSTLYNMHKALQRIVRICVEQGYVKG